MADDYGLRQLGHGGPPDRFSEHCPPLRASPEEEITTPFAVIPRRAWMSTHLAAPAISESLEAVAVRCAAVHGLFETWKRNKAHSALWARTAKSGRDERISKAMTIATRVCATCVFWIPRDGDETPVRGRCRARLLDVPDPRLAMMTQANFVCPQWCEKSSARDAAE